MNKRNLLGGVLAVLTFAAVLAIPAAAQYNSRGRVHASDYRAWNVTIKTGTASGAGTIILPQGTVLTRDGREFSPFSTNAPITITDGNTETVTPSAVSGCTTGSASCSVTATFVSAHPAGGRVTSGTGGLQEAINDLNQVLGGGVVVIDAPSSITQAIINAAVLPVNVGIEDIRTNVPTYYTVRPTTLTTISAGAAAVPVAAAPAGIAAATYHVRQTYVDILGGETTVSSDATVTTTASLGTITVPAPAATAGAVGWRLYVGAGGGAAGAEILYAPTSAGCTQSTLVTTIAACSMSSSAVFAALITGTGIDPVQNTAHTTFGPVAVGAKPTVAFQNVYGPFTALATISTVQQAAEVQLPAGYLNRLGKGVRICGKATSTTLNTAAPTYGLTLSPNFTISPVVVSTITPTTALTGAANNINFCFEIITNAIGASGTLWSRGQIITGLAASGSVGTISNDNTTAVSSTLDLTAQLTLALTYASATANTTAYQVQMLWIEDIN